MAGEGAIDADASAGDTAEERVKRDRLVSPEKLDRPFSRAAGQRRVPGTGVIATLPRERVLGRVDSTRAQGSTLELKESGSRPDVPARDP